MAKVKVFNMKAEEVGSQNLNDNVFGVEYNEPLIHEVVVAYNANQRQGNKSTLTRSEVRGHSAKPYRQKGTGRARQGSTKGPQFIGGGVVFAPKPRDYSFKMNRKQKNAAIKSVLTSKVNESKFIVLDELKLEGIKTKEVASMLKNLNVEKALIVTADKDENVVLSARNIPTVRTALTNTINVYDILKYDTVVVTKDAVAKIEEVYA